MRGEYFLEKVLRIYFMGGVFLDVRNVIPLAEANVYGDPIECKIVFQQAKNL